MLTFLLHKIPNNNSSLLPNLQSLPSHHILPIRTHLHNYITSLIPDILCACYFKNDCFPVNAFL